MTGKFSVAAQSLQSPREENSIALRWKSLLGLGIAGMAVVAPASSNAATILQANPGVISPAGPLLPFSGGTGGIHLDAVTPGSTFSIDIAGFNANGSGSLLTAQITPTFGGTTTYTNDAEGGQVLTVTSSEVIGLTTTTDTFTISVPTNFDPSGTLVGSQQTAVIAMEADIGGYNAGPDPITFSAPITPASLNTSGNMIYSGGTYPLNPTPNTALDPTDTMLESAEGINAGGSTLSGFDIHSFSFTFSYPTAVPEPASLTMLAISAIGLMGRRRRFIRVGR